MSLELERANERAAVAEREREHLRQELTRARDTSTMTPSRPAVREPSAQTEELLAGKDAEIRRLQDAISKLNKASVSKQVSHSSAVMDLQARIAELTEEVEALKERLADFQDYDDLKRELTILKTIEFSSPAGGDDAAVEGGSLETLLVQKNKRLQDELTACKVQLAAIEAQLQDAVKRELGSRDIVAHQQTLIAKLEEDVAGLSAFAAGKGQDLDGLVPAERQATEASIVQIITSQRDRYRKRNQDLEEAVTRAQKALEELQGKLKTLTDDNVKLYEKIRYLEGYQENRRATASVVVDMGAAGTDVTSKYRPIYEDRLNPFTEFNERERRKGYYNLNVAERATLNVSKFFLANKHARTFVFFYAVVLHLFMLSVIYGMGVREECVHDHAVAVALSES
eukprot:Unigene3741_Nuclearia_a/m.11426 Unigene3741_Nuclearia_a/g.11426  ORF Unigene3741_Nuclearia_a/g.11426 Unigene3741_Nuclearia_a/m.11426 type:complete len:398 (+) Unigene3741_Nuclearia_a:1021-2214(+)